MNELFYELIRVSIGTQDNLSHIPKPKEWNALYDIAKKQSLVGVCFAALQRLGANVDEGSARIGMSEMLYLKWMGMAAKIQQMNQTVDEQCVALQKRLSSDGLHSCILKGQGVGQLYSEHLRGLRQSGDIDVYVDCGMAKALAYAREKFGDVEYDYMNAHVPMYENTEVELHYRMQAMTNLFLNMKLQKWVMAHTDEILGGKCRIGNDFVTTPSLQVNRFYILLHAYNHLTGEGLGFRQLMDYFFVLRKEVATDEERKDLNLLLVTFGMQKFSGAIMWIMQDVFGLEDKYIVCAPNESEGRFVLNEVLIGGNFGHHDERKKKIGKGKWVSVMNGLQHSVRLFSHYPSNTIWLPIWIGYHFLWKRLNRI